MAFNGNGTFVRLYNWVTDAANGIFVRADRSDAELDGMATGLSTCITKDGQTTPTANIPLGGFKITGLGTGTGNTDAASVQNVNTRDLCEGRLTLTSGTPVTTADVNAAATLYWTPYKGNEVALYDGTNWVRRTFSELSVALGALTALRIYDVFAYDNSGTVALETLIWTNDTTRATALTTQDGVLVKSGALTRRYLGSFHIRSGGGATDDSLVTRWVWNYYNRVVKPMRVMETTDTWSYNTGAFRQANANTANQLDFLIGWDEELVSAHVHSFVKSNNPNFDHVVAIGLDSTTAMTSGCINYCGPSQVANQYYGTDAQLKLFPGVGRHKLVWLELGPGAGTSTWAGDGGAPTSTQSGIHGEIRC